MSFIAHDESELVVELWEKIKEYIPQNKRDDAALTMVETFLEHVSVDYNEVAGADAHLEHAIEVIAGEEDDEDPSAIDEDM